MVTPALDQTQDLNGAELYRLSRTVALPDFVKSASADDVVGPEGRLEQHCFAHPRGRLYPGHTPAATYVSTAFFLDKRAEWDPQTAATIEDALDGFARFHGISERIAGLKAEFAKRAGDSSDAPDPDDYAVVVGGEGYYPLRNVAEVKAAAAWLRDYRHELPYDVRRPMAERIVEKADAYGAGLGELDDFLSKQAGHGACSAVDVARFLYERSILYKRAGFHDIATQVAVMAKSSLEHKAAAHDPETLQKLAGVIDQADRETGLRDLAPDLPPPEDTFFAITPKVASALREGHVSLASGNIYDKATLASAGVTPLREHFGDSFADAVSVGGLFADPEKLAAVAGTLPRGDAEAFDRLLASMGIHPLAKEAAHEGGGFDDEALRELAGLHGSL